MVKLCKTCGIAFVPVPVPKKPGTVLAKYEFRCPMCNGTEHYMGEGSAEHEVAR
jgi:hypothetical protein